MSDRIGFSIRMLAGKAEPPYHLEPLLDWLGIEVIYEPLPPKVAGYYARIGPDATIVVNINNSDRRRRWTLAHELAHHFYEVGFENDIRLRLTVKPSKEEEELCDHFAAELLMPESAVRAEASKPGSTRAKLSDIFLVSHAAMKIRLRELGIRL